ITVHAGAITYLWVRIHTDEGLIGLGESYPNAEAEAAIVHSKLAPVLLGKATGQPIYKLLGGASRESIRIYNTCYDRLDFNREPALLAGELLKSNIKAMKIWPFDPIAKETGGNHISA